MSKITGLSSGPINGTDSLTVELVEAEKPRLPSSSAGPSSRPC